MELREALITQAPSLSLQRAAQAEIARLDAEIARLKRGVVTDAMAHAAADEWDSWAIGGNQGTYECFKACVSVALRFGATE